MTDRPKWIFTDRPSAAAEAIARLNADLNLSGAITFRVGRSYRLLTFKTRKALMAAIERLTMKRLEPQVHTFTGADQ